MNGWLCGVSLTFRFAFDDGADVGVIVTDGVIVKFEPVRELPYGDRCDGPPNLCTKYSRKCYGNSAEINGPVVA